jgi:type I restriction enzyme R subunit
VTTDKKSLQSGATQTDGLQSRPTCIFKPFNPKAGISRHHRHLPHWQQASATYFVTFRLGDALPQAKIDQWKQERAVWLRARGLTDANQVEELPETDRRAFHRHFSAKLEGWLDEGSGACSLRDPAAARIVADALRFFDGQRCAVDEFVVMPNHVHVLCCPFDDWLLEHLLHSWKRHSARLINQLLGRSGNLWLDEYFDHGVRSQEQLEKYRRYIRENPQKANLRDGEFMLGRGTGVHVARGTGLQPISPNPSNPTSQDVQH